MRSLCYINLTHVSKVWDCREATFVYDRLNTLTEETANLGGSFFLDLYESVSHRSSFVGSGVGLLRLRRRVVVWVPKWGCRTCSRGRRGR